MMTAEFQGVYDETETAKRAQGETDTNRLEQRFEIGRQFRVSEGPFATFLAEMAVARNLGKSLG